MKRARPSRGRRLWIEYDGERWPVTVYRRRSPHLTLRVQPNLAVEAVAPLGRKLPAIRGRIECRAAWIARQRRRFTRFHPFPPPRRYVAGETHLYLGRQYRLKVHRAFKGTVKLVGRYLHVHAPRSHQHATVRRLLEAWYDTRARNLLGRRLEEQHARLASLKLPMPRLLIRRMKRRWGSCTRNGAILLNRDLVKTPSECVDYVIVHELAHLREHGHGPRFRRLLSTLLPDWERRKARLNSFVICS